MKTKWHVITGAPSSGKTTLISYLGSLGYFTFPEIARLLINLHTVDGKNIEDIRNDDSKFQNEVFRTKLALEKSLDPTCTLFLDNGLQETLAYLKMRNLDTQHIYPQCHSQYAKVFLLEPLKLENDSIRIETKQDIIKLYKLIEEAYRAFDYEIIKVPVDTVQNRAKYVLSSMNH